MTTERVYSNGFSLRYPSARKHTSEWQKKLLHVSITPTGFLTEWHPAFTYICTACYCNTLRNCLSCRLHRGGKKSQHKLSITPLWKYALPPPVLVLLYLFIWWGRFFVFKLIVKDILKKYSITAEVYVYVSHIGRIIISGKAKSNFSPFHGILSRD